MPRFTSAQEKRLSHGLKEAAIRLDMQTDTESELL